MHVRIIELVAIITPRMNRGGNILIYVGKGLDESLGVATWKA